jgi:hypothetical protein
MILFVNNNVGIQFLTYEQIVVPPEVVSSHGHGGVTAERAEVILGEIDFVRIKREDEELIMFASQIIMRNGTFGLS